MIRRASFGAALLGCLLSGAATAEDGAAIFTRTCAACHGPVGEGIPGFAPPLARPPFWESLGEDAPAYLAGVVTRGLVGRLVADGQTFVGVQMPPQTALSDDEILAVAAHVLETLNQGAHTLRAETLAAVRADPPAHADLMAMRPPEE